MREINKIVLHHTATRSDNVSADDIRQMHLDRGWSDIGYHYVIEFPQPGRVTIQQGRAEETVGAHVRGHNQDSIGIAVIGNFETKTFPDLANVALVRLLTSLCLCYDLSADDIYGHNELAATLCPGKHFPTDNIRAGVRECLT